MKNIRNFCIIAHIDHGKSTLADRMLEITGTIDKRKMKEQVLDRMDLERERGITIKLQPVTMRHVWQDTRYKIQDTKNIQFPISNNQKEFPDPPILKSLDHEFILNLIDTPGHVDFTYEVSRSLAAVEGAVLLVDATQGIQAQTLANLYLALDQNLVIIPVINKIDLPAADVPKTKKEITALLGCAEDDILLASGKTGEGVREILDAVILKIPPPSGRTDAPLRALIFDSYYDEYRGVVAYVRIVDGLIKKNDKIFLMATKAKSEALDAGLLKPDYFSVASLAAGAIGYIVTGFKDVGECRVGDTVTLAGIPNSQFPISNGTQQKISSTNQTEPNDKQFIQPLKGYAEVKPMVFAGIFPQEGNDYESLREAMDKLKLNDASLTFEPEHSEALGFGFRCGFLGLLHLEIFQERLRREFNLDIVVTTPSVAYKIKKINGDFQVIRSPLELPVQTEIAELEEPWVALDVIAPRDYLGALMSLIQEKRGAYINTEYIEQTRVILHYEMPMAAILTDFYDKIKSVSSGYASINYEFKDYRPADAVRLDIIVADDPVEALSTIVYRDDAFRRGKEIVETLKETLPRQMFVIKLQAAVGGKVVAAERISAFRKDVTAKLYGGDVSRKRKLLEKQKKGKKKMLAMGKGSVEIPPDTFVKILRK